MASSRLRARSAERVSLLGPDLRRAARRSGLGRMLCRQSEVTARQPSRRSTMTPPHPLHRRRRPNPDRVGGKRGTPWRRAGARGRNGASRGPCREGDTRRHRLRGSDLNPTSDGSRKDHGPEGWGRGTVQPGMVGGSRRRRPRRRFGRDAMGAHATTAGDRASDGNDELGSLSRGSLEDPALGGLRVGHPEDHRPPS
jgi:hypothetical protein